MSAFTHYGPGQRLAFAMLCIGFCLCLGGAIAPFWFKAEVKMSSLGADKIPIVGNFLEKISHANLMKVNLGVWIFCIQIVGSEEKCYKMYSTDTVFSEGHYNDGDVNTNWIVVVRAAIAFNIMLSLLCGVIACCRCMCCSGGRTICHGVFAFLAGASGVIAIAIMSSKKQDLVGQISFFDMEYDWAFFIYVSGSCLIVVASLLMCFALPNDVRNNGVVMQMPTAAVPYISVNQNTMNAPVNQYELNGQIQNFEPLPAQACMQPPDYITSQ